MASIAYTKGIELPSQQYRLRINPGSFIHDIFGYVIVEPHINILDHFERAQETLDLAPRGCGKTRIGDIGYSGYLACNNPNIRILIVSDTDRHAIRFLSTIKAVLETHPLIKRYYGDLKGEKWTDHELTLKTRTDNTLTEPTISAMGAFSGQVTGSHFNIIIADDLANFANSRTEYQREWLKEWFKTSLMPTLLPGGEFRVFGTRYHYNDLYNCLINELGFDTQIQEAIIGEDTPNEHSIWEAHMPLHTKITKGKKTRGLIEIRDGDKEFTGIGTLIFNLQYQNNVELQKKGVIFEYDWFQWYETIPQNLQIFMGVDPAISQANTADFFAAVTIGIDTEKNVYVLDVFRDHLSFEQQITLIHKKWSEWKPRIVGIEQVAYQEALIQHIKNEFPAIRLEPVKTIRDKVSRAYTRSGLFENDKVLVRKDMHLFVDELVLFPDGKNDDMFDAFDFALTVSETKQHTSSRAYEPIMVGTGSFMI